MINNLCTRTKEATRTTQRIIQGYAKCPRRCRSRSRNGFAISALALGYPRTRGGPKAVRGAVRTEEVWTQHSILPPGIPSCLEDPCLIDLSRTTPYYCYHLTLIFGPEFLGPSNRCIFGSESHNVAFVRGSGNSRWKHLISIYLAHIHLPIVEVKTMHGS